jgi:hypothetical protein
VCRGSVPARSQGGLSRSQQAQDGGDRRRRGGVWVRAGVGGIEGLASGIRSEPVGMNPAKRARTQVAPFYAEGSEEMGISRTFDDARS